MLSKEEEMYGEEGGVTVKRGNERDDLIFIATQKYLKPWLVKIISPYKKKGIKKARL